VGVFRRSWVEPPVAEGLPPFVREHLSSDAGVGMPGHLEGLTGIRAFGPKRMACGAIRDYSMGSRRWAKYSKAAHYPTSAADQQLHAEKRFRRDVLLLMGGHSSSVR
jgi:hypothetical protein